MNVIREIAAINERELKEGIVFQPGSSWHHDFKDSAWVNVGGLPYELTEGDVICIMSQWGEVEDLNLVRDEETGKSKGFAFLKYEDQRSTILAVDNMNGITVLGRTIRVDHCQKYKLPKAMREKEDADGEDKASAAVMECKPGHAYEGKELAGSHDIHKGVDLWAAPDNGSGSSSDSSESDRDSGSKKRKRESKSKKEKQSKKSKKKKSKKEKKEKKRAKSPEKLEEDYIPTPAPAPREKLPPPPPQPASGNGIADWRGIAVRQDNRSRRGRGGGGHSARAPTRTGT